MSISAGPIVDRSVETLMPSDRALERTRRQLLESVDRIAAGDEPIGVRADHSVIMACDRTIPVSIDWQTLVPQGARDDNPVR